MPTKISKLLLKKLFVTIALFAIVLLFIGKPLLPFIMAFLTAYLFEPLVFKIETKFKTNRKYIALFITFIFLILLLSILFFIIPSIIMELKILYSKIPVVINFINYDLVNFINSKFNINISNDILYFDTSHYKELLKNPMLIKKITLNSLHFFENFILLFIYPIALFFSIINYHNIIIHIRNIIPEQQKLVLKPLIDDIISSLSKYIRGQSLVIVIMTLYYSISLFLFHGSILIGMLTGLLLFIPYLGIFTGLLLSLIVILTGNTDIQLISVFVIFGIGYLLEHWVFVPYFIGNSLGVHPIFIIMFILVFGYLFGLVGVILALPLTSIFSVILKYIYFNYCYNK